MYYETGLPFALALIPFPSCRIFFARSCFFTLILLLLCYILLTENSLPNAKCSWSTFSQVSTICSHSIWKVTKQHFCSMSVYYWNAVIKIEKWRSPKKWNLTKICRRVETNRRWTYISDQDVICAKIWRKKYAEKLWNRSSYFSAFSMCWKYKRGLTKSVHFRTN